MEGIKGNNKRIEKKGGKVRIKFWKEKFVERRKTFLSPNFKVIR